MRRHKIKNLLEKVFFSKQQEVLLSIIKKKKTLSLYSINETVDNRDF